MIFSFSPGKIIYSMYFEPVYSDSFSSLESL